MNKLYFLDILTTNPSLKINNSNSFHTIFGMLISIITILSITANFIYFTHTSFLRTNYQILERVENNLIPSLNLKENKISFTLLDALGTEFKESDRLFSLDAKFWEMNYYGEKGNSVDIKPIPLTNCTIYQNGSFKEDFVNLEKLYPTSKCLDFNNLDKNLFGKYASLKG
jgi:hypothetical protein